MNSRDPAPDSEKMPAELPPHGSAGGGSSDDEAGPPVAPVDQMLIAWLDGELDDRAAAELESRLATDAELRNRLHEFQRTWDMLDEVTATEPHREFVQSTIEMVVSSARRRRGQWHRWPMRLAIGLLAFSIPAVVAWNSVRWFQYQPWRQFVADLEFLENMEMYDQVESVEFLEKLNSEGLFAGELDEQ